jgi:hypothetical protein
MTAEDASLIPWLADLAEVPADAAWPRLLTTPSNRAVASYGADFIAWATEASGGGFRWWQELTARLTLAHDGDGRLVHRLVCPTTPRQAGKTTVLFWLCMWRLTFGTELFGEPQMVVSISKNLNLLKTAQAPMRRFARAHPDEYDVRDSGLETRIIHLATGSEWHLLSEQAGGYGRGVSLALVDEAWAIRPQTIDLALGPTQIERSSPQMILTSTANDKPTPLMIGRRALAVAELGDADASTHWMEWSLPPGAPLDDLELWKSVLPHWHDQRLDEIVRAHQTALGTRPTDPTQPDPLMAVASQMGNRWPASVEASLLRGEPLVAADDWAGLAGDTVDDPERIYVAVEDHSGFGAAIAAVCVQPDGRYGVDGWLVDTWAEALGDLDRLAKKHDTVKLQAGASLMVRLAPGLRATPITSAVTRFTLPAMRELVTAGRVVHDSTDLDEQVGNARVTEAIGGLNVVPGIRSDLLRAASWALAAASRPRKTPSIH